MTHEQKTKEQEVEELKEELKRHPNISEEVDYICGTCRNKNSAVCLEHKRKRKYYLRKIGIKALKYAKNYCTFWAYKPVGLWDD